ncbi:auxin-responsive protein IAA4-like [Benincasa hispida]|uniref:auxin-responsive protein IAA4-like n=1 Tax=Benincasa hispida TaxID=102211 RepID=UPI00190271B3|nr:auxin-responsive protein IAA4-like [Benincasa hispida]
MAFETGLNLDATELRLGPPGVDDSKSQEQPQSLRSITNNNKRSLLLPESNQSSSGSNITVSSDSTLETPPPSKAQIVGWPPVQSFRRNILQGKKTAAVTAAPESSGNYVKVSMDGAPYLRKIDVSLYKGYPELLQTLEDMFKFTVGEYSEREGYKGSEYVPTYEDKDGDWMLVGDVPWEMFMSSCKRLRIMKGSEAKGLGCVA